MIRAENPDTLTSACNLAMSLAQGKYAEAELPAHVVVQALTRTCPSRHAADRKQLEERAGGYPCKPSTNATAPAAAGAAQPLPAGTRVFVQQLVAKPENNGKRARVLSFDRARADMLWRWTTGRSCR